MTWPKEWAVSCPIRGVMGFFLGETLVNAMKHGRPGSVPNLTIVVDRKNRNVNVEVTNEIASDSPRGDKPYGGLQLLKVLATRIRWDGPREEAKGGRYSVKWTAPVVEMPASDPDLE
jgi:two-component sensor histidine kinase